MKIIPVLAVLCLATPLFAQKQITASVRAAGRVAQITRNTATTWRGPAHSGMLFEQLQQEIARLKAPPSNVPPAWITKPENMSLALKLGASLKERQAQLRALPRAGLDELKTVRKQAAETLAAKLKGRQLIMIGETHYQPQARAQIKELIFRLRELNPGKRVVVFTEFLNLDELPRVKGEHSKYDYYRRGGEGLSRATRETVDNKRTVWVENDHAKYEAYAGDVLYPLVESGVEVYPLEDPEHIKMYRSELSSFSVVAERNKNWARQMDVKMREVRQTDPDAVFIVYAGASHVAYHMLYAMPKFFAGENTAVVNVQAEHPLGNFPVVNVWGENSAFYNPFARPERFAWLYKKQQAPVLFYWNEANAKKMARLSGFDYVLLLPKAAK